MIFSISKLIIWFKNGTKRELEFLPNKINVITGRSNTGKSAILEIMDYCFFASKFKFSQSQINENATWYGLVVSSNGSTYSFARKAPYQSKVSAEYYLSSIGEVPEKPTNNTNEKTVKKLFESIFSIDSNAKIEYGGSYIKPGSKISVRYFQMFNTISGDIIENSSGVFFDKQNDDRYREALPRIFDLAVGIETVGNVLKKEKLDKLEKELSRIERKNKRINDKRSDFINERSALIKKAKEYSIINPDLNDDESWKNILNIDIESELRPEIIDNREQLEQQYFKEFNKIKKLTKFQNEYDLYKNSLQKIEDSIKPVDYLRSHDSDLIKTSIFENITSHLSDQIKSIKLERVKRTPLSLQVNDEINNSKIKLKDIEEKLKSQPSEVYSFSSLKEKYFFMGQLLAKANLYNDSTSSYVDLDKTKIEDEIKNIKVDDTSEKKELTIKAIEEIISEYIEMVGTSLENYQGYQPYFKYKEKALSLRKPKSTFEENVGSSSNQMFLHLFFMLSIHEVIKNNHSSFVAPYLIIDQPSRPYYGDESDDEKKLDSSDEAKIKKAFKLLDDFISRQIELNSNFQMIVLEHVPKKILSEYKNVNIVEEFRHGNALVREENIVEDIE